MQYAFEFDSVLTKKAPRSASMADFRTFLCFAIARYAIYFLVCERIFFILLTGMICLEVQKPNTSIFCKVEKIRLIVYFPSWHQNNG